MTEPSKPVSRKQGTERLQAFSDGVFAVVITILVLEFHPPHDASWSGLLAVWPTAVSYAVSYWFIAIVWVNHHHLLQFTDIATPRLIWGNFAHLFSVSLIPFSTEWIADTHLAGYRCNLVSRFDSL
ncbi:MAG: putative integral rane protein [Rhizobacter sp.]|nr:putative integral rane protein [Rhizobacter sp.]